jgi:hypothetical protein
MPPSVVVVPLQKLVEFPLLFPLFRISMASPRCSWWCRLVWCSAVRLDARNKGERSVIAVVVIVIAVAFDLFKGKP